MDPQQVSRSEMRNYHTGMGPYFYPMTHVNEQKHETFEINETISSFSDKPTTSTSNLSKHPHSA